MERAVERAGERAGEWAGEWARGQSGGAGNRAGREQEGERAGEWARELARDQSGDRAQWRGQPGSERLTKLYAASGGLTTMPRHLKLPPSAMAFTASPTNPLTYWRPSLSVRKRVSSSSGTRITSRTTPLSPSASCLLLFTVAACEARRVETSIKLPQQCTIVEASQASTHKTHKQEHRPWLPERHTGQALRRKWSSHALLGRTSRPKTGWTGSR